MTYTLMYQWWCLGLNVLITRNCWKWLLLHVVSWELWNISNSFDENSGKDFDKDNYHYHYWKCRTWNTFGSIRGYIWITFYIYSDIDFIMVVSMSNDSLCIQIIMTRKRDLKCQVQYHSGLSEMIIGEQDSYRSPWELRGYTQSE